MPLSPCNTFAIFVDIIDEIAAVGSSRHQWGELHDIFVHPVFLCLRRTCEIRRRWGDCRWRLLFGASRFWFASLSYLSLFLTVRSRSLAHLAFDLRSCLTPASWLFAASVPIFVVSQIGHCNGSSIKLREREMRYSARCERYILD